jgi:pilus assembly protein Flp/PilA
MIEYMRAWVETIRSRDEGQALVEYALILFLVSIVAIGALSALGGSISDVLNAVADTV